MKKLKLRKWVVNCLAIIYLLLILFLSADCEPLDLFIISKILGTLLLFGLTYLLDAYTTLFDE